MSRKLQHFATLEFTVQDDVFFQSTTLHTDIHTHIHIYMCVTHIHAHTDIQTYTQINTRDSGCGLDSSEKFASLHTDLGFLARKSKNSY